MRTRAAHPRVRRSGSGGPAVAIVVLGALAAAVHAQPGGSGSAGSATSSAGSASGSAGSGGSVQGSGSATIIQIPMDSQAPEVTAAASPTAIKLGERFTLFVTATYEPGVNVNLREPVELGGAFEVKKKVSTDTVRPDGRHVREWQIDVYAWELGELSVPPVAVTFTTGGKAGQVQTNAVPLRVTGVLGDADDPKLTREYAPPVELHQHSWLWKFLHWFIDDPVRLGILIGSLIAGYLTQRRLRKRTRRVTRLVGTLATVVPRRRLDMTSERALERLLAIEQSGALDRDADRKPAYLEMNEIIRDYLGARFGIATAEQTSAELLRALAPKTSDTVLGLVERWLERCDLVKYGGFAATRDDAHAVLDGARTMVASTTAKPVTQEAAA